MKGNQIGKVSDEISAHQAHHSWRNNNLQESLPFLTDNALLQLYHQGDQRAFEQLVERYQPHLFCYLMKVLRDSDMVGDVMQHVWIQCAFAPSPCLLADTT